MSASQSPGTQTAHCCQELADCVETQCDDHPAPGQCADHLIGFAEEFDEYGLWIHDGYAGAATSWRHIAYCPFCGAQLPASRRDEWFDRLDALRIEPEDAPEELRRYGWWLG